jgi:toxin-antitoxin system PIN domain toxin
MTSLVDVNVVFALLVERHVHHATAWAWWSNRPDESVGLSLPVRLGVLRLLTNARAMEGSPASPTEALEAWDRFEEDPRTFWIPDQGRAHELCFRRFVAGRESSPNLWTDAWIAALAESAGMGLTSFDSGFSHFGLLRFEYLQAGVGG